MTNSKQVLTDTGDLRLNRVISGPPDRVFDLWTQPDQLKKWWGPENVRCVSAQIDLRVGGAYRIGNRMPDGSVIWISGIYQRIERPRLLQFSWSTDPVSKTDELVAVRFAPHQQGTLLTIVHSRIGSKALRDSHRHGWSGCLNGLSRHMVEPF